VDVDVDVDVDEDEDEEVDEGTSSCWAVAGQKKRRGIVK
jgi:hypothetical protein